MVKKALLWVNVPEYRKVNAYDAALALVSQTVLEAAQIAQKAAGLL